MSLKSLEKKARIEDDRGPPALVAQLDRALGYEPRGQRFESSPVQMHLFCHPSPPISTNCYLLVGERSAILFDAGMGAVDFVKKHLKPGVKLTGVYLTHSHWDHIFDLAKVVEEFQVPCYAHPLDQGNVKEPGSDGLFSSNKIGAVSEVHDLKEEIHFERWTLQVIHTPGHCVGSVCYYCKEKGFVITGDTLFAGAIGRLDLPTAEPEKMETSLKKLFKLPKDTIVYPGHGPQTTIGDEYAHW